MIDLLRAALFMIAIVQPNQRRKMPAMIFAFLMVYHGAVFGDLGGESYFFVSAFFGVMAVVLISAFAKKGWFSDCILFIAAISVFLDIYGSMAWNSLQSLDHYVMAYTALYSLSIIIFLWRDSAHDHTRANYLRLVRPFYS